MKFRRTSRIFGALLLAGGAVGVLCPATGTAADAADIAADGDAAPAVDLALAYRTGFEIGAHDNAALRGLIEESAQLKALEDRPTATYTGLVRRAEGDVERLETVLRSEGYYDGTVRFAIDETTSPVTVTVAVTPGPRYALAAYDIRWAAGTAPEDVTLEPGLAIGMPAEAKPIADAQERLVAALHDQGRPFARVADRVARIDRAAKTMHVTVTLDAGPPATFGATTISGLQNLDEEFVRAKIPWREGERFERSRIETLRTALLAQNLFASVRIDPAAAPGPEGRLPVTVTLVEGLHRSVGAGAAYSTSDGFLLDVYWEHRNLFAAAEKLRLSGTLGTLTQRVAADLRKPDFLRPEQDLVARSALIRTVSDAYDEATWTNYLGFDRRLSERWRASAGGSFELSRVTDQQTEDAVQLVGLPLTATRDNRDDVLNPTQGSLLGFELVPYTGHGSETLTFALGRVSASSYLALDSRRRIVLAGRTRVAALAGEKTAAIPATKRLYAGGGGSIRGYEFQKVGPLDEENDPVGGRSLFEVGLELRLRVTDEIGIVPFVEGGNVRDDNVPDPFAQLRWAAGLGLRYHTAIGPARVDFAVPIDRRENVDDPFQIYFSLGQAF